MRSSAWPPRPSSCSTSCHEGSCHAEPGHAGSRHAEPRRPPAAGRPGAPDPTPPHALPPAFPGVALGVAIALHPALVLFAAVLPPPPAGCRTTRLTRIAPALTALTTAALLLAAAQLADPAAAGAFRHRLADHAAIGAPGNETALGVLTRLGLHGPPLVALWIAVAAVAAGLALRRGRSLARDRQHLLAAGVVGCATLIVAPVAGPADLCWLLPAASGRLGRRPEDRALWPVVAVTVALLPSTLLDPGIEPVSGLLLRKAPTLLALAAATALPFRRRDDPLWHLSPRPAPLRRPRCAACRSCPPGCARCRARTSDWNWSSSRSATASTPTSATPPPTAWPSPPTTPAPSTGWSGPCSWTSSPR
ncbi:hypothetical protein ACFQ0M_07565 [Kitasatospora aburaviensis]